MHHLFSLGFSQSFLAQLRAEELDAVLAGDPSTAVGRVVFAAHGQARLLLPRPDDPPRSCLALLPGPLRAAGEVVVGDWVLVDATADPPLVLHRLERSTLLRRRDPDGGAQPVAANVDVGLVCTAVGHDLNPRRVERWLGLVAEAGMDPVVVLTKSDRGHDPAPDLARLQAVTDAPVVALSALDGVGLEALLVHLGPGRTASLVGSSGVGKSTLLNALRALSPDDADAQATGAVRPADDKGRHTTTSRELFVLPGGGCVIDNPGVREVGLLSEDGLDAVFPEIEALLSGCRYRDCGHDGDEGCAVEVAIDDGRLDPDRVAAWRKLHREAAYEARKHDVGAQAAERQKWKKIFVANRQRTKWRSKQRGS